MVETRGDRLRIPGASEKLISANKRQLGTTVKLCGGEHIYDRKSEKEERVALKKESRNNKCIWMRSAAVSKRVLVGSK